MIDTNYEQTLKKACFLIPDNIKKMIAGKEYIVNDIGTSGGTGNYTGRSFENALERRYF